MVDERLARRPGRRSRARGSGRAGPSARARSSRGGPRGRSAARGRAAGRSAPPRGRASTCRRPASIPSSAIRSVLTTTSGVTPAQHRLLAVDDELDLRGRRPRRASRCRRRRGSTRRSPRTCSRQRDPLRRVRPVDLGDHRREDRRPRRDLGDLHVRAEALRGRRDQVADLLGDRVAVLLPVVLGREVDLHVRDERAGAQEVVPDEAVEVERGRRAGVDLDVRDLGLGLHERRERRARRRRSPRASSPRACRGRPAARSCCRTGAS